MSLWELCSNFPHNLWWKTQALGFLSEIVSRIPVGKHCKLQENPTGIHTEIPQDWSQMSQGSHRNSTGCLRNCHRNPTGCLTGMLLQVPTGCLIGIPQGVSQDSHRMCLRNPTGWVRNPTGALIVTTHTRHLWRPIWVVCMYPFWVPR